MWTHSDCRNVSVKIPRVYVCLSSGDFFIFSERISSFLSNFCEKKDLISSLACREWSVMVVILCDKVSWGSRVDSTGNMPLQMKYLRLNEVVGKVCDLRRTSVAGSPHVGQLENSCKVSDNGARPYVVFPFTICANHCSNPRAAHNRGNLHIELKKYRPTLVFKFSSKIYSWDEK